MNHEFSMRQLLMVTCLLALPFLAATKVRALQKEWHTQSEISVSQSLGKPVDYTKFRRTSDAFVAEQDPVVNLEPVVLILPIKITLPGNLPVSTTLNSWGGLGARQ